MQMREYRFHWQTWVGIGLLVLLLFTMFLPDGQVQRQNGSSAIRISIAKWALTVDEEDIDISQVQLKEGRKLDNDRVVPVLRMWGWMILIPVMLSMVSVIFMITRRRTFSGLLMADGLVTLICELIIRIRVPSRLFWEEGYESATSVIVLLFAIMLAIYGILCMALFREQGGTVVQWNGHDDIYKEHLRDRAEQHNPIRPTGMLLGVQGEYAEQTVEVRAGEEIVLGRDPKYCMLIFRNPRVSRRQCGIRYDSINGYYQAIDYSSTGTTLSDGTMLTTSEYTSLPPGTVLYIARGEEAIKLV
ncbi:MAG: FHA domain-containing protein [Lachnospiraceae bacterium]|nr:FHA domain-containing protein [Lachnospiraceae bacterium]